MYVITDDLDYGSDALNYILEKKEGADQVNIVAVATALSTIIDRDGAEALNAAGIMLIGGYGNDNKNRDVDLGGAFSTTALFNATPRFGVSEAPLDNIIPVTTISPTSGTDYGINSFFAAAPQQPNTPGPPNEQSFAGPAVAAMAALTVQKYLAANSGTNPSIAQIKRAMMSGVNFTTGMNARTITHDFPSGVRQNGGIFDLTEMCDAIIEQTPQITDVSMTPRLTTIDPYGSNLFDLNKIGTPTNWTISWGDNSFSNQSGIEVLDGSTPDASHTFPFHNTAHTYFPTIYAMKGTGDGRAVYLQEEQLQVAISTPFNATSAANHYTLERVGSDTMLTLGPTSESLTDLPSYYFTLGSGDVLTVNFSNGNPLQNATLTVLTDGTGGTVEIIGTSGADTISASGSIEGGLESFEMEAASISASLAIGTGLLVSIKGGAGNDSLIGGNKTCTLRGEDGNDTLSARGSCLLDGGADNDAISIAETFTGTRTLYGGTGNDLITGGVSAETIYGDAGADTINGGAGNDSIIAGDGNDSVHGDNNNDVIYGDAGNDLLYGDDGNDWFEGGAGTDNLSGGNGNDHFNVQDDELDTVSGDSGTDSALTDQGLITEDVLNSIEEILA
jgi:Ca2+-binding RTX toxin-like protein